MNRPLLPDTEKDLRKGYGKVPKYLQKFKIAKDEQIKQKEIEKEMAMCPPGTRRMPENER